MARSRSCASVSRRSEQGRLGDQVGRQLGEGDATRRVEGDFVADAQYGSAVDREHLRLQGLLPLCFAVPAVDRHGPSHVLLQQLLRIQEVVQVVLLEDVEAPSAERPNAHGLRLDGRGDVGELELDAAAVDGQRAHLAHEPEVLVVDGDRHGVARRGGAAERGHLREARRGRGRRQERHASRGQRAAGGAG
jgi:hypothetical protein